MSRRTLAFFVLLVAEAAASVASAADVTLVAFEESPSCRMNEIPLGQPARIEARHEGSTLDVKVAANFGCGTTAGRARVEEEAGAIRLYADTILPGHPTPACKCTRHLRYRIDARTPASKIVFLKDSQVEGEGRIDP